MAKEAGGIKRLMKLSGIKIPRLTPEGEPGLLQVMRLSWKINAQYVLTSLHMVIYTVSRLFSFVEPSEFKILEKNGFSDKYIKL